MTQHQGNATGTHSAGGMTGGGTSAGMGGQGSTGVQDSTYNVISVVYHTLQGAETIQKYMKDAQGGDQQVEQFLREAAEQYKRLAQRGRECLAQMLHAQGGQGGSGQQMQGGTSGGQQGMGGRSGQQSQSGGSSGQYGQSGASGQQSQSGGSSGQYGQSGASGQQSQSGSASGQMGGSSRGPRGS